MHKVSADEGLHVEEGSPAGETGRKLSIQKGVPGLFFLASGLSAI